LIQFALLFLFLSLSPAYCQLFHELHYISDQPGGIDGYERRVCKKFRDLLNESGMQISNMDQLIEKILGIGGESHINNLVDALPTNH